MESAISSPEELERGKGFVSDLARPRRRSMRMQGYNHPEPGAYFVTACTHGHETVLGSIHDGQMRLNACGKIVEQSWLDLPGHFSAVQLDVFVAMPNHIHAVLFILPVRGRTQPVGAGLAPPRTGGAASSAPTLGDIMRVFKSTSAVKVNRMLSRRGRPVWQRSYYGRIIRNEVELVRIQQYVMDSPLQWELDRENPEAPATTKDDFC